MEDVIIECLRIYGFDVYYLPRKTVNFNTILSEDPLNMYDKAYTLEMYMANVNGFEGEGDLLTKFGVEIRDSATFIVSKRRWEQTVGRTGNAQLPNRPAEGDVLFFPLTKSFFEIRRVETKNPFFQVGKVYVFKLECELMQYSSERFETGIEEIDTKAGERSIDIGTYELLTEDGFKVLLEDYTPSKIILEEFMLSDIDPTAQNETFRQEIDILDFTERNPFEDIQS